MTVYLLHFERPYRHARHYLGSAEDLEHRLDQHRRGQGARLMEVITAAGIGWQLARTWEGENGRKLEAKFKRAQHNAKLCPICNPNAAEVTA